MLLGNDGNLYGVTFDNGQYGYGTVFQLAPSGDSWTENVLYNFQGQSDGGFPYRLVQDSSGNLIGLAYYGRVDDMSQSTVFMLSPSNGQWIFNTLRYTHGHDFELFRSLTIDPANHLYLAGGGR